MNFENTKLLCEYQAGSHAYGLNTVSSDIDKRGAYITTELPKILGMNIGQSGSGPVLENKESAADAVYYEVRHFFRMLQTGNSNAMEMLFNHNWTSISPLFKDIQACKYDLVDPDKVYNSTRGYSASEYELAQGSRTGKLGGKRQEQVARYGFSPKNWTNLLRLLTTATEFFESGNYPLNLEQSCPYTHALLFEIKTHPERFTKQSLHDLYIKHRADFDTAWARFKEPVCAQYKYDQDIAAQLTLNCYLPELKKQETQRFFANARDTWETIKHFFSL